MALDGRNVTASSLQAMTQAMIHRGPDDDGFVTDESIGIGFRRLSIIDVTGGHQPLSNETGDLHLVLNGEIYNHVELRRQLEERGHSFKTQSDAEVVLHLYEDKGPGALEFLNGMFAFALMDTKRRALWIARDRLGIKPLYYGVNGTMIAFASDINALRTVYPTEVNVSQVLSFLGLGYAPGNMSLWRGVQKLLPGHYLWIDGNGLRTIRYWQIDPGARWEGTVAAAAESLEELLKDAVRLELRSDVPIGAFLSGGLDSSAIVSFAAQEVPDSLRTYTVVFEGKAASGDVRFAREVATRYSTRHVELPLTPEDASSSLDELLPLLDEPIADSALIPAYWLSKAARADGIKVLLNGAGGDEIFAGYGRHHPASFASPRWIADTMPSFIRPLAAGAMSLIQPRRGARARQPSLAWAATVNGADMHTMRMLLREPEQFLQFKQAIVTEYESLEDQEDPRGYTYQRMQLDLDTYLPNDVLLLTDKATMAASVEGRVPLLDHRLVEFAFSLPPQLNVLDGQPKGLLKRILQDRLPDGIIHRSKEGFNAPSDSWLRDARGFDVRAELLDARTALLDEILDPHALGKILSTQAHRAAAAPAIFALYLLNRWHRTHNVN